MASTPGEQMIFDGHVYPVDIDGGPQLASSSAIAELMDEHALDQVMLVSRDAGQLTRLVDAIDGAYATLWVDPRSPVAVDEARAALAHPRFRALKLNPALDPVDPADPLLYPLLELAQERGTPVAVHCGHPPASLLTLPWRIEAPATRFPEVRFVLVHMGYCVFPYHDGAMDVAAKHPNVWLDISGMPHPWRVKEAVERVGAARVVHGSAAPYHDPALELMKVRMSELSPAQLDAVLGRTAMSLYLDEDLDR